MRSLNMFLAAALVATLPLAGCQTFQSLLGGGSVATTNQSAVSTAEKGLTLAHIAYQAVGLTLQGLAQNGTLTGANATTAKSLFDQAGTALDVADQADAAANAQGINNAVAQTEALLAQINALLPKK